MEIANVEMGKCENSLIVGQMPGLTRCAEVECAEAARQLAASHLAGPTASAALAEGLVAVALLSADLGTPEEAVTLHIQCDGPLGSLLVEATNEGTLRGYTGKKILNDLDASFCAGGADGRARPPGAPQGQGDPESCGALGERPLPLAAAFGATGTATVMASLPGKVLTQSSVRLMQTPRPERALATYYAEGAQREVKVAIDVALDNEGRIATARGILFERMPGSDAAEFAALANATDGRARSPGAPQDQGSPERRGALGERPLPWVSPTSRPLRFACRCSHEKALATLAALPADERAALAAQNRPIDIYCHMCGKCHTIDKSEIVKI